MIKVTHADYLQNKVLRLSFSDGSLGDYDLQPLIERKTELTIPLENDSYFKQFFLELGALCWRNGLELCPDSIHEKLASQQKLHYNLKTA